MITFPPLTPFSRFTLKWGGIAIAVVLVVAIIEIVVLPSIDVWRAGIHPAERAVQRAIPVEQQAQQAAHDAAAETQRVLGDYANAQQNVKTLADAIAREKARADALQTQRDALASQIAALDVQRVAKPRLVTLEEARRVLGTFNQVYR